MSTGLGGQCAASGGGLRALVCLILIGSTVACEARESPAGSARSPAASPATTAGKAGDCHVYVNSISIPASDRTIDCAQPHRAETFAVGTFAAEYTARLELPPQGSPALRWAFKACDREGKRFVGGDWRGGRLSIRVVVPSPQTWAGGARWYRCDIYEFDADGVWDNAVERTGSLRGALTRRLPLVHTCFNEDKEYDLLPIACDKRHRLEFVGIWTAPELRYDDLGSYEDRFSASCWSVIGAYAGVSKKVDMSDYVGVTYRWPTRPEWGRGDRDSRCFLWSSNHDLTRSVKGAGLRALAEW